LCADILLERDSVTRFFASGFFHEYSFSKPLKIRLGSFQIFPKILLGDIRESRYTTVPEIIDPVFTRTEQKRSFSVIENERFGLVFTKTGSINSGTGINDTDGKFAAGVNYTGVKSAAGVKFATGVNDNSGYLPLVSMTSVVNLPPVPATPAVHLHLRIFP
jgi:hypothetical protein